MKPSFWTGRHVAVTGGTSGIGRAATFRLLESGALVTVIARNTEVFRCAGDSRIVAAPADVTDPEQLRAALDAGRDRHGPVRSVITSAGIVKPGYFHDLTDADLREHMEVNYFGTLHTIRRTLPDLMSAPRGTITCISSEAAFLGVFGYSAYCASKFAVRGLCETLRQEYRPHGITVTGVYPPDVDTPMLADELPLRPPEVSALSLGDRPLTADAVARALLRGTAAGKADVVPGVAARGLRLANGAFPRLLARVMDARIATARK